MVFPIDPLDPLHRQYTRPATSTPSETKTA
jgi:hypothetical protein